MSVAWTIEGEASKPWDETSKTFDDLGIDAGSLEFPALETDVLSLTITPDDWRTYTRPELGQIVTLKRDGVIFFYGTVTNDVASITGSTQTITIQVSGPWWWMERIELTENQTDGAGGTADRVSYVFGTDAGVDLKTAIETLIDRAIALGVPMQRGTVATFFDVPRITLNQSTCSQAFTELLRLVPDCFAWFDYTTSPPTLNVDRRGVASVTTLTIGTDNLTDLNIQPIYEMEVARVELDYVNRSATGLTQFQQQASGTAATGRVQTITISGKELDTFLPNELFETFDISSVTTDLDTAVNAYRPEFGTINAKTANVNKLPFAGSLAYQLYNRQSNQYDTAGRNFVQPTLEPGLTFILPLSPTDTLPQWVLDEYGISTFSVNHVYDTVLQSDISGTNDILTATNGQWYWGSNDNLDPNDTVGGATYWWIVKEYGETEFLLSAIATANLPPITPENVKGTGFASYVSPGVYILGSWPADTAIGDKIWFGAGGVLGTYTVTEIVNPGLSVRIDGTPFTGAAQSYKLFNPSFYRFTRRADYSFIAPPANLAANLLAAQDFVPYEGTLRLVDQDAGGTRYAGTVVNVANSITEHSTMKALVSNERLDLRAGTTEITLGTPERIDYRTFVDRIRSTPQDNVVFL